MIFVNSRVLKQIQLQIFGKKGSFAANLLLDLHWILVGQKMLYTVNVFSFETTFVDLCVFACLLEMRNRLFFSPGLFFQC